MDNLKKLLVRVVLPLSLIFGTELMYRDSLFESSFNDIPLMQQKTKLKPLMHNVSLLDSKIVKLPILALCLNLMSKPASFYFISAVIVVHYFSTLLQSYYQQPRPF